MEPYYTHIVIAGAFLLPFSALLSKRYGVRELYGRKWNIVLIGCALLPIAVLISAFDLPLLVAAAAALSTLSAVLLVIGFHNWIVYHKKSAVNEKQLRHENTQLLRQTQERLDDLMQATAKQQRLLHALNQHAVVSITDSSGRIIHVNDTFERITGYRQDELVGHDYKMLRSQVHSPDFYKEISTTLRQGQVWQGEVCLLCKDGSLIWQDTTIVPFMDDLDRPYQYISINTNITDRKLEVGLLEDRVRRRTLELAEARDQALKASQAKSEFLAAMSHEIRTPLHSVLGMLDLLKDVPMSPQHREYVYVATSSGKGLLSLISDILDISRIESGQLVLDDLEFDLRKLMDEVAMTIAPLAHVKGVELTAFIPTMMPAAVRGDPNRLRQVFINLLGNAVKFTPEGGTVEIYGGPIAQDDATIEYLFEVRDTGAGVSDSEREKIFHRFTQGENGASRYGGAGLGLSICLNLVSLMGGEIGVDPNDAAGTGSMFYFNVVLRKQRHLEVQQQRMGLSGLRALVIGSSGLQLTAIQDALGNWGVRHDHMANHESGAEILRLALSQQDPYHLVIVNQWPGEDSRGYLPQLRKAGGSPRFLLLTDLLDHGWDQSAFASGATLCMQKPFTADRLYLALQRLVNSSPHGESIPLPPALVPELPDNSEETSAPTSRHNRQLEASRILLVDDQHANLLVAAGMLAKLGIAASQVDTALDGESAVKRFKERSYDLVLMDCQMPGLNGFDATQAIRFWESEQGRIPTPILAFTADATVEGQRLGVEAGMNGYLVKPVSIDELRQALSAYLQSGPIIPLINGEEISSALQELRATLSAIGLTRDSEKEIAELLLAQLPELLRSLERELDAGTWETARAASHVIKGSMANTIFPRFKEPSNLLHECIRTENTLGARAAIQQLQDEFSHAEHLLQQLLLL